MTYTAAGSCVIDANQAGNGTYAAAPQAQQTITVTGKPQSITFTNPPASGTVGGTATLLAAASSGLPVALSVDNPGAGVCTLSGSTVSYAAAGFCVVDANQAGNGTYAAAPQAQQTITVTGKPQSITFTIYPPAYGTVDGTATLFAAASSDLPVVFSVDPKTGVDTTTGKPLCTLSGSTVSYAAAGFCVVDANQAGNGTYAAAAQAQQTITVTGKPQSITFTIYPPAYGTVDGTATLFAAASSDLPVVFSVDPKTGVDTTTGKPLCTLSGSTVSYAAAGFCVIDANQAGNGTYAAAAQAQQKITVNNPD